MVEKIYQEISKVIDPEVGFNLVELGLIYDVQVDGDIGDVKMTLSTKGCPLHGLMVQWVEEAVVRVDGINSSKVEVVWEPAWNITMASDEVQSKLAGSFGGGVDF